MAHELSSAHLLERLLRRRVVERVQHGDAAQQLLLHRGAARVLELDLADLLGALPGVWAQPPRRARGKLLLHEGLVSSWMFPFGDNALLQRVVQRREKARH